jgi:uncharacterized protein YdeI (YjbR/CyaY-like superfamily)
MAAQTISDDKAVQLANLVEWREWLATNSRTQRSVWLVIHNKSSEFAGFEMPELVEHALCFGWIDAKAIKRDEHSRYQQFTPRNPRSTWSAINRARIEKLTAAGLMEQAGQDLVDLARRSGTWDCLAEAQNLVIPADLQAAFATSEPARCHFEAFPPSSKRLILQWIALAKRPETRARRVAATIADAAENRRANHPR